MVVLAVAVVAIIGVLELLLWAWMASKVRTGRHWARVTSTVLFAVNAVGQIFGSSGAYAGLAGDGHENAAQQPIFAVILGWAILAAGLNAVVLFWQKGANPFFRPQQFFHPGGYGYPYPYPFPPQGYPTEQYAQAPVQGGFAPEERGSRSLPRTRGARRTSEGPARSGAGSRRRRLSACSAGPAPRPGPGSAPSGPNTAIGPGPRPAGRQEAAVGDRPGLLLVRVVARERGAGGVGDRQHRHRLPASARRPARPAERRRRQRVRADPVRRSAVRCPPTPSAAPRSRARARI